ncbi:type II toxin-antitoxin system RelE/ParE family toxin [Zavarzinia sp. CC-PAN008]|uniref:type II toxin-antitoxin system RelE/ParE family toxin n=1 Tax=Zavarzinia sp. CC-PAN008 TaxID=3243332 RepID=UPI003F749A11
MDLYRTGSYLAGLKRLAKLGASEGDIIAMEDAIALDPARGDVIPGAGGLRKVRFRFGGKGSRGGGRTVYYVLVGDEVVYLLAAYAKADKADLTRDELKLFRKLVEELTHG